MKKRKLRYDRLIVLFSILLTLLAVLIFLTFQILKIALQRLELRKQTQVVTQVEKVVTNQEVELQQSLQEKIDDYLTTKKINTDNVSIVISDAATNEKKYTLNPDVVRVAASTYKLSLAMLYVDRINSGKITLNTRYTVAASDYDNDYIGRTYKAGSKVRLDVLLTQMLQFSENTPGHLLYRYLGGYSDFLQLANKYSANYNIVDIAKNGNFISANFANDVLLTLYNNRTQYEYILNILRKANRGNYLDYNKRGLDIAQKYGDYDGYYNVLGIVFTEKPFVIAIYTKGLGFKQAQQVMADIVDIGVDYFKNMQ